MKHARMLRPDQLEEIWAPLRYELSRDYVGLLGARQAGPTFHPDLDDGAVRENVLAVFEHTLRRGEAEAGEGARGVEGLVNVWRASADEIVARIRRDWIALGRNPGPGDIVWLQEPLEERG